MGGIAKLIRFTLALLATAVVAVAVVRWENRSVVFAFGVNWLLMFWAVIVHQLVPIRFPSGYFATRAIERGRVYGLAGVRQYQRFLRITGLWMLNQELRCRRGPESRQRLAVATEAPEVHHVIIFLAVGITTIRALMAGWLDTAAWLILFNLLHNGYPVLSMREIRARLQRSAQRLPKALHATAAAPGS